MSDLSTDFLQQLDSLPPDAVPEVNFFTAGGSGYLENPTSDLLALFMGENAGVPPWLLNALLHCLNIGNEGDALAAKAAVEGGRFSVVSVETKPLTQECSYWVSMMMSF